MQHGLANHICTVLALYGKYFLTNTFNTPGFNLFLKHGFQFFKYVQSFNLCGKLFNQLARQRMYQSKFQYRCVRAGFLHVLVCDSAGDEADFGVIYFHTVDGHG